MTTESSHSLEIGKQVYCWLGINLENIYNVKNCRTLHKKEKIPQNNCENPIKVLSPRISERPCTTPDNRSGTCVNIDNCPQIAEILRNAPRPLPSRVQNYIVQLGCGMVNNKVGRGFP